MQKESVQFVDNC